MQKTLPLYHGPSVIGSASLTYENGVLSVCAKTYASVPGICRAYIKGAGGNLLIGVLVPEGSAFIASRSFSRGALMTSYINPEELTYAYVICKNSELLETEWKPASDVLEFHPKNKIAASLMKASGALCDDLISPGKVAVPLFTGRPFPAPDVLCLATPVRISGELFGIISFDEVESGC